MTPIRIFPPERFPCKDWHIPHAYWQSCGGNNTCHNKECVHNFTTRYDDGAEFFSCGPLRRTNLTFELWLEIRKKYVNGEEVDLSPVTAKKLVWKKREVGDA